MNGPVFRRALRDAARPAGVLAVGHGAFFYLILLSSSTFASRAGTLAFFRDPPAAITAFLGGSADFSQPSGWLVIGMMHPVVLALQAAGALMVASGAVATELERGTLELVLTRPVQRTSFLLAKVAAALVGVTAVQVGGVAGALIARGTIAGVEQIDLVDVFLAFLGAWALFGAFALVGIAVSAGSSLRSRAVGAAVGIVVASFFVNFVALLFDEVKDLRFVTPFHYFRPAEIIAGEALADLLVLLALGLASAWMAIRWFARRDLTR